MAKKTPAATENSQDAAQALPASAIAPEAAGTLPFAQKRDELIKKFRANAVPREADYKQLLDQHYDVAGALGMANSGDNNGATTGNGLVLENDKLHVKAKASGGLQSDTNGISLVTGSSLVIGTDNKLGVKINKKNGLTLSTEGEVGVNLYVNNTDTDSQSAAVIANNPSGTAGLWINVGDAGNKKGLKQYKGSDSYGGVLGVSHDNTLKIDTAGRLGVNTINLPVTGAISPLAVNGNKQLYLKLDPSLSTVNGTLGFSKDRAEAVRLYGRVLNTEYFAFNERFILYTFGSYYTIIANIHYTNEFNSISVPNKYKSLIVKNVTRNHAQLFHFIYSGGIFSGHLNGPFQKDDEVYFSLNPESQSNFKLTSI